MTNPVPTPKVHRWPYFSTPLHRFLAVVLPVLLMMGPLVVLGGVPTWIRLSAGVVVLVSMYAFYNGYLRRVEADAESIRFRRPGGELRIFWRDVRRAGRYTPLDRNPTCQYVYVTRLETPPVDRRDITPDTIQLQDRPGLLATLETLWSAAQSSQTIVAAEVEKRTAAAAPGTDYCQTQGLRLD